MKPTTQWLIGGAVAILALMLNLSAVLAQGGTATPTLPPTTTPVFVFNVPIQLPTGFLPPEKTVVPITIVPYATLNMQPGNLVREIQNGQKTAYNIMGPDAVKVMNFLLTILLGFYGGFALIKLLKRGQSFGVKFMEGDLFRQSPLTDQTSQLLKSNDAEVKAMERLAKAFERNNRVPFPKGYRDRYTHYKR